MPFYAYQGIIPVVGTDTFVHPTASLIGDVIVGKQCYIGPSASLRGDFGRIIIGDGSNIQDNCVLHSFPSEECVVESEGHIGHSAVLHGCRVGENSLVGISAVVMDGVVIGKGAIVGALSFVPSGLRIEDGMLAMGVPARILREVTKVEIQWKSRGTAGYRDLARQSIETMEQCLPLDKIEDGRMRVTVPEYRPLYKSR
jgi:phenylacetic acid degradation protein